MWMFVYIFLSLFSCFGPSAFIYFFSKSGIFFSCLEKSKKIFLCEISFCEMRKVRIIEALKGRGDVKGGKGE